MSNRNRVHWLEEEGHWWGQSYDGMIDVSVERDGDRWYSHGGERCGDARRGPFVRLEAAKRRAIADEVKLNKLCSDWIRAVDCFERYTRNPYQITPTPRRLARVRAMVAELRGMRAASMRAAKRVSAG